jgi:transcriptional regulator with PAS, ATPase and Fis domain
VNTLLTWLGQTDVDNMLKDKNAAISSIAIQHSNSFDKILILSNAWDEHWEKYIKWLKRRMGTIGRPEQDISIVRVHIETPIDYFSISQVSQKWINKLSSESTELYINLSSGTPAMTTISVLIGKAKSNTHFYQATRNNEILLADIPIDFKSEYNSSVARSVSSKAVSSPSTNKAFKNIVAVSHSMKTVIAKAKKLAPLDLPILVLGETGTGKEVISNAIHSSSSRYKKEIKTVNCGALPESLADSVLFGHVKGAFTGAVKDHKGIFEQADGGTLFLDEVGELIPEIQVKLLRALQQKEITRVGDDKTIVVDVRVIAATHRDLMKMVEDGDFREDLFYRLALGVIELPALRDRIDDIEPLAIELGNEINDAAKGYLDYESKNISDKGIKFIISQPWFGNVRELWNTLNRAFLLNDNKIISDDDIKNAMLVRNKAEDEQSVHLALGQSVDIVQLTNKYQKKYIAAALKASGNVRKTAAEMLTLGNHQNLKNWMERLDMLPSKDSKK